MKNGITLIALIITIIVLVILAAVSISAVYNSNIINYAVNGAINYASEATRENEILDQTASIMQSAVDKISDIAGGSTGENPGGDEEEEPEEPIDEPGIDFGKLTEEEIDGMIGQYVDYTPVSGTFSDHVGTTYNGYNGSPANTELSTIATLKWKILGVENNILTLISDTTANTNFGLGGAEGYNNGVLLLNNACKAMYSNSNIGATGRSLDIDDIERYMTYDKTTFLHYGNEFAPVATNYPKIFEYEKTGAPGGTYGSKYDLSDQDSYINGRLSKIPLKGSWTYYTFSMSTSTMEHQIYTTLFSCSTATVLSSRCVGLGNNYVEFRLFSITRKYCRCF